LRYIGGTRGSDLGLALNGGGDDEGLRSKSGGGREVNEGGFIITFRSGRCGGTNFRVAGGGFAMTLLGTGGSDDTIDF